MKTSLTYGIIMAVAGALLTLVMYLAGFHDSTEKMKSGQWIGLVGGLAIAVACLTIAMRERRAARGPDQDWGYGSAFGTGVLTALVASIAGGIFAYVYFAMINPQFSDVVLQMQVEKMEAAGAPAAQIERVEPMMRKWMSPAVLTISQSISGFLMGVVLSLILAIFQRRPLAATPAEAVPPPLAT